MSQPPSPYDRSYSFTAWSISNPNDPHQGQKIDLELNEIKQSLDETQARLAEIQRDDGLIRDEAVSPGITDLVNDAATAAATAVYATNLALVADKAEARANLMLSGFYPDLNGNNLSIYSSTTTAPVFAGTTTSQTSQGAQSTPFPGLLGSSSYTSRQFRSSVLFGTLRDYATDFVDVGGSPVPDATVRVDNISMALLYAGRPGQVASPAGPGYVSPTGYLSGDYTSLANLPSAYNPLASLYMVKDAVDTHKSAFNHGLIPSSTQKAALDAATTASGSNRYATVNDITASGSLTTDQTAAIAGSASPSASNVVITTSALNSSLASVLSSYVTTSALTAGLATKANTSHTHTSTQISDSTTTGRSLLTTASASAARTTLGLGTIATADASTYLTVASGLPKSGGTMTGVLILQGDPTTALGAATKSYADGNNSLATNGWTKLPGGLIMQWGYHVLTNWGNHTVTKTFPVAFPTACTSIVTTRNKLSTNYTTSNEAVGVSNTTTSDFAMVIPGIGSSSNQFGVYWVAYGY